MLRYGRNQIQGLLSHTMQRVHGGIRDIDELNAISNYIENKVAKIGKMMNHIQLNN